MKNGLLDPVRLGTETHKTKEEMAKNPQVNAARVSFDFHPAAHRLTGPRDSLPNQGSKSHSMHIALLVFLMDVWHQPVLVRVSAILDLDRYELALGDKHRCVSIRWIWHVFVVVWTSTMINPSIKDCQTTLCVSNRHKH